MMDIAVLTILFAFGIFYIIFWFFMLVDMLNSRISGGKKFWLVLFFFGMPIISIIWWLIRDTPKKRMARVRNCRKKRKRR